MEKYGVFNNNTGEYTFVETKEEALQLFWSNIVEVARMHFHGTAYVKVTQNEDNTETWVNDCSEEIEKHKTPAEIEALIKKQPPVEVLP
jgi:hypothetical protein